MNLDIISPNKDVSPSVAKLLVAGWAIVALGAWMVIPFAVIPTPLGVLKAFGPMVDRGLVQELLSSLTLNVESIAISTAISLVLAYLTVLPVARPVVAFVTKLRFLGLTGLTFLFGLVLSGHELKVGLLVLGMTVFFTTSMVDEINAIPKPQFEYARTLCMSEWRVVLEVVVLGTIDKAFGVLRQNAAMGWVMLTMVEGLVRSEGGLGTMLLNENKVFALDAVFALQTTILVIGLLQDFALGVIRNALCPYANIQVERRR